MESRTVLKFGAFTYEPSSRLLRHGDNPVNLQARAEQVFDHLLRNHDRVISKKELKDLFWRDVVIEENAIEGQVSLVRRALRRIEPGRSYIRTSYKRGWQFVAEVEEVVASPIPASQTCPLPLLEQPGFPLSESTRRMGRDLFLLITATLLSAIAFFAAWVMPASRSEPHVARFAQLTNDGRAKSGPLLTDGRQLFFNEAFNETYQIASVPVSGGDPQPLSSEPAGMLLQDISPDGRLLLVRSLSSMRPVFFTYSLADKRLRQVAAGDGAATWDHAGDALTFSSHASLFSVHLLDANERRFLDLPGHPDYLRWSPDGTRLRMTLKDPGGDPAGTWEFDKRRAVARKLDEMSKAGEWATHGVWSADGEYFLFDAGDDHRRNLWVLRENRTLGRAEPARLTDGPASWTWPAFAKDNSQILAVHDERRSELSSFDPIRGEWRSAWRGLPAYELDYSRDGRSVAYIYQPTHTLWKSSPDGSGRIQLTWPAIVAHQPHWSPDGRSIAFMGQKPDGHSRVFVLPIQGGRPEEPLPVGDDQGVPTWSPDGKQVIFGELLGRRRLSAMCLHFIDIPTRSVREVPGTHGLWSPRWSPDGKYILAVTTDNKSIRVAPPDWTHSFELVRMVNVDNVMWSYDSKYIYFDGCLHPDDAQDIYRVGINTKRLEKLVGMRDFVRPVENWYGVSPEGTLLASRGYEAQEIYALKCRLP